MKFTGVRQNDCNVQGYGRRGPGCSRRGTSRTPSRAPAVVQNPHPMARFECFYYDYEPHIWTFQSLTHANEVSIIEER